MGTIINGKYVPDAEPEKEQRGSTLDGIRESNFFARELEKHGHNLIQPHNTDGTPNQDFIDYYPEDAKNYGFIPESEE